MQRFLFFVFIFLSFYCTYNFGQTKTADTISDIAVIDKKIQEYKQLAHSNPAEGTQKLIEIRNQSVKIGHKEGAMKSSMGLVMIYYSDGNYKKSIEESRFVEKYAKELRNNEYLSEVNRMRAIAYGEMGLLDESIKELDKALLYIDKVESDKVSTYRKALIYEGYAGAYDKKEDIAMQIASRQKSIVETKKMAEVNDNWSVNAKYQNLAYQYASLGYVYSNQNQKDSANYYFEEALKIVENKDYEIYTNVKATLLSDLARFYDLNGKHNEAILFAKKAEALERQSPMPYIRRDIYQSLFNSYVETDKKDSSKYYLNLYTALNDSLIKSEKASIMAPVKQIISDKDTENKNTVKNLMIIGSSVLIAFILGGLFLWRRKKQKLHIEYEKLIEKIKTEHLKEQEIIEITEDKIEPDSTIQSIENESDSAENSKEKSTQITNSTVKSILQKLDKFERSDKYLKNEISLTYLATHVGTNTKYLSEIIKHHKKKSYSNYINGLRVNYIATLLYKEPRFREYKISYLAELGGFSSREVFAVVFKKETGVTPSYYIDNLKNDAVVK